MNQAFANPKNADCTVAVSSAIGPAFKKLPVLQGSGLLMRVSSLLLKTFCLLRNNAVMESQGFGASVVLLRVLCSMKVNDTVPCETHISHATSDAMQVA